MYKVNGFTALHTGCDLPWSGDTLQCDEGVGICLDPVMTSGWWDAEEV